MTDKTTRITEEDFEVPVFEPKAPTEKSTPTKIDPEILRKKPRVKPDGFDTQLLRTINNNRNNYRKSYCSDVQIHEYRCILFPPNGF